MEKETFNFIKAFQLMKEGKAVARLVNKEGTYIVIKKRNRGGKPYFQMNQKRNPLIHLKNNKEYVSFYIDITQDGIFAEDWFEVKVENK